MEALIAGRSIGEAPTQMPVDHNNEDVLETQVDDDELTELLRGNDDHTSVGGGDDESLLAEIYEGMGEQKASEPVTDRLAKIVEKKCSVPVLGPEDARAAVEKFPRPGNCPSLQTPAVNPKVWETLAATQRKTDWKQQQLHRVISAATAGVTKSVASMIGVMNRGDPKSLEKPVWDSIEILGLLCHVGKSNRSVKTEECRMDRCILLILQVIVFRFTD